VRTVEAPRAEVGAMISSNAGTATLDWLIIQKAHPALAGAPTAYEHGIAEVFQG
jgi:hypothetical protein